MPVLSGPPGDEMLEGIVAAHPGHLAQVPGARRRWWCGSGRGAGLRDAGAVLRQLGGGPRGAARAARVREVFAMAEAASLKRVCMDSVDLRAQLMSSGMIEPAENLSGRINDEATARARGGG